MAVVLLAGACGGSETPTGSASGATGGAGGTEAAGGAGGSSASGGGAIMLSRVSRTQLSPRLGEDQSIVAQRCLTYDHDGDPVVAMARPEIVDLGGEEMGGLILYTLREGRDANGKPIRSSSCQHRQQQFHFDPVGGTLSFPRVHDDVLDFFPDLPQGQGVQHDFCTTKDLRASHSVDGRYATSVTLGTGEVDSSGLCVGPTTSLAVFAEFDVATGASVAPTIQQEVGQGSPSACDQGLMYITDDIPTAIIAGDHVSALWCGALLDAEGNQPRYYKALRRSSGDPDFTGSYDVPVYDPAEPLDVLPVWFEVGGKQGSLLPTEGEHALFIYAADDGGLGRLAWFEYDFGAAAVVSAGGFLPGQPRYVEKYALGATRDPAGNSYVAFLWQEDDEYCEGGGDVDTPCFKNDSGHLGLRVLAPDMSLAAERVLVDGEFGGDIPSDVAPDTHNMAATHPDMFFRDGHLFVVYSMVHYPNTGCGRGADEPCRGKSDIELHTSQLEIWRVDSDE